jgi:hypothetical protein
MEILITLKNERFFMKKQLLFILAALITVPAFIQAVQPTTKTVRKCARCR